MMLSTLNGKSHTAASVSNQAVNIPSQTEWAVVNSRTLHLLQQDVNVSVVQLHKCELLFIVLTTVNQ